MPPLLVAFKGLPGTGKSTLARALGTRLGWPVLDKDDFMDPPDSRLAYDLLFRLCGRLLGQGLNVVCDSPLMYPSLYIQAQRTASAAGARLMIIDCHVGEAEHRRRVDRIAQLGLPPHKIADWPGMQAYLEHTLPHAGYAIDSPRLSVDLAQPVDVALAQVVGWLARHAPDVG